MAYFEERYIFNIWHGSNVTRFWRTTTKWSFCNSRI